MKTRKDYMSKKCTYDEYYGQFVNEEVLNFVRARIGEKAIKESTNPHFNDIPLEDWDAMAPVLRHIIGRDVARANGSGGVSLSDMVCTAKAAARKIKNI